MIPKGMPYEQVSAEGNVPESFQETVDWMQGVSEEILAPDT